MDVLYKTTEDVLRVLRDSTGRPVGDAIAPDETRGEAPKPSDYPYAVVYEDETPDWRMSGPLTGQQEDKQLMYRIVCVGRSRQESGALASRVREAMVPSNFDVNGYRIQEILFGELGRMFRNTDIRPPIFSTVDLFQVWVTPTGDD